MPQVTHLITIRAKLELRSLDYNTHFAVDQRVVKDNLSELKAQRDIRNTVCQDFLLEEKQDKDLYKIYGRMTDWSSRLDSKEYYF